MDQIHPLWFLPNLEIKILLQERQAMSRQVLGGVASIGGEDGQEARSTFDRLLREYFATLVSTLPETSEECQSSDTRSNHLRRDCATRSTKLSEDTNGSDQDAACQKIFNACN